MLPSWSRGTAIGIGVSATITTRLIGRLALECLTTIRTGATRITDIPGGDTITTITRRIITATTTTVLTTTLTMDMATVILTTSTAHTPAPTTVSTATMCLIHTDTGRAALAVTAAALTPTIQTVQQAAVLAM